MSTHELQTQPVARAPKSDLVANYHRIAISAVNAALACRPKKQESEQQTSKKTRQES